MAQQTWTFTDITGTNYALGLYHGEDSGNLMVYLNDNILLLDFKVLDSKDYRFYVGHELMVLSIKKTLNDFEYGLSADVETETPLNKQMKKSQKEEQQMLLVGQIILAIVLLSLFIYNCVHRYSH